MKKNKKISDESGSDSDDDDTNSCYSSLSDFVYEMRNSGICGEIRGKKNRLKKEFSFDKKKHVGILNLRYSIDIFLKI